VLRKLWPVLRDRCIEIEVAALGEQVGADGSRALRRRVDELERVLAPRRACVDVGDTAPDVDDRATVDVRCERRADFAVLLEVLRECLPHALEPRFDVTLYLSSHRRRSALPS